MRVKANSIEANQRGILYVVATPIGNLEDITLRALRILKEVTCVYAEDTREARKLLSHFGISVPCERYDDRLSDERKRAILERCVSGESIALVSDAGTPIISDPGFSLVDLAWREGIQVVPLPGASSPIAALSACGFPMSHFVFWGFLPRSPGKVRKALASVKTWGCVVFFESPYRIVKTLERVCELAIPGLQVCVARELSKMFEEFVRGTPETVKTHFETGVVKGEFCVILYVDARAFRRDEEAVLEIGDDSD